MVVRKALFRQSGSWYCEVTSGPPLCVSIFAQEEFDTGAWFDGLQAGMNAAIAGMAEPVEILLRAGVEPNTTLVENPYSCQIRSDGKTRKITAIKLLNSIGGRHIGAQSLAARLGSNEDCLTVVHRKMLNTADHNKLESRRGQ